jgi:hypothetical protein
MESSKEEYLELKYCERCGGLRLRLQGSQAAYCEACAVKMAELPPRIPAKRGDPALAPALPETLYAGWAMAGGRVQ